MGAWGHWNGGNALLIAGDIGGTKTLLALYAPDVGVRRPVAETEYHSADYASLESMVREFLAASGQTATAACFDVAGPVVAGRAHLTNLPWNLEEEALRAGLGLRQVTLLNDLKAVAYAVPFLNGDELHTLNAGKPTRNGPIAVAAPGRLLLRGRPRQLLAGKRAAAGFVDLPRGEVRPRLDRARVLRSGHRQHL